MTRARQFLDYIAFQEDAILTFNASEIVLAGNSDASYLSKPNAHSQAGGHLFLSNHAQHSPNNGAILNITQIIKNVMSSAAKAKLAAFYIVAKECVYIHLILEANQKGELTCIGCTCGRFWLAQGGQQSLANEAVNRLFTNAATIYEKNVLPRCNNESDSRLLRQLDSLRELLKCKQLIGDDIKYTPAESESSVELHVSCTNSALSNLVM